MPGALAARLGDPVGHSSALGALVVGIAAGAALAAAVVVVVGTGGVGAPFVAAGIAAAAAGGGLAGASIGEAIESVTGAIITGSADVFVEKKAAARAAQDTATCSGILVVSHATPLIAQGSDGVFINKKMAARKGDKLVCGAKIVKACTSVYVGGGPATAPGLTIADEVPGWLKTTLAVVALGGAVIATGGAALVFGPWAAGGAFLGSVALGKGGGWLFGEVGEHVGKKYGNEKLGRRVGETFGEVAGGLLGGFLGGWVGGRLGPVKAAAPPVEEPEPITQRWQKPPPEEPAPPPVEEPAPDTEPNFFDDQPTDPNVFLQEKEMSCGEAAARQVIKAKTGENVPEGDLRLQSQDWDGGYHPDNGTRMDNITRQLRENGVPEASEPKPGQTVDDLADATRGGDPAIAHFKEPNHFITVEGVHTNPDGSRMVAVSDPARGRVYMPESEFNRRYTGWAITTKR